MDLSKNNKHLKLVIAAVVAGVLLIIGVIAYFEVPGTLVITVDSNSQDKNVTAIIDNGQPITALPVTISIKAGNHQIQGIPGNKVNQVNYQAVRVWPLLTAHVIISIQAGDLPGSNGSTENQYLQFFPYRTSDFILEAITSADMSKLTGLKLTVLHRFGDPITSPSVYKSEHDFAVQDAQQYIQKNNIPKDLPLTVSDLY